MLDKKPLFPNWEQKKNIFLNKTSDFFSFGKCRIVPKNVKGGPSGFINIHSIAKYQKLEGGPLGTSKKFRKKIERGTL